MEKHHMMSIKKGSDDDDPTPLLVDTDYRCFFIEYTRHDAINTTFDQHAASVSGTIFIYCLIHPEKFIPQKVLK
ncbi:hypothetical protein ACKXGF_05320 [Alkalibacillus sp. S2W]|uniref:hypothetical protein n=1 Tax=Alkalibacillus sp. S2W TaxID=3386553 RepID=UPI00398C8847